MSAGNESLFEARYRKLLAAASTPLNPIGGDGEDRCRICYQPFAVRAAGCVLAEMLKAEGDKLTLTDEDFYDLR